jgi:hypothetical protein
MKNYNVEFSYNIQVRAEDKQEAEAKALEMWGEISPRPDEMNTEVIEEKD